MYNQSNLCTLKIFADALCVVTGHLSSDSAREARKGVFSHFIASLFDPPTIPSLFSAADWFWRSSPQILDHQMLGARRLPCRFLRCHLTKLEDGIRVASLSCFNPTRELVLRA